MKKKIFIMLALFLFSGAVFADNDKELIRAQSVQQIVDNCGMRILNANRITEPVVFVYDNSGKTQILKASKTIKDRQVVVYSDAYKFMEDENELAAFLSREIVFAVRTYDGIFSGRLRSLQMIASPKKFELVADKMAVNYMVKAGYDPVALITYIKKTCPQKKSDTISTKNLTSKRLAAIYEYIYTKYPYYLVNNEYIANVYYQNFLLTSQNNRKMLEEKIKNHSTENLKYE